MTPLNSNNFSQNLLYFRSNKVSHGEHKQLSKIFQKSLTEPKLLNSSVKSV